MRRLIWCSGAVLIGAAAWFYLAATYVCNYPNSAFAHCAELAYRMGGDFNPVYRLSCLFADEVQKGVDVVLEKQGYVRAAQSAAAPRCEPCVPSLEEIAAADPFGLMPALQGLKIELESCKTEPMAACQEKSCAGGSEECTSGVITVGAFAPPAEEDADGAPKTMPPCPEDKVEQDPSTMPYIEDENDPEGTALFEFWKSLFDEKADKKASDKAAEPKTMPEEESEATPEQGAAEENQGGYQMPASHYSSNPSCSGCPRTVTCPYTGKTYPADPKDDEPVQPTTSKKKKKKKMDDAGNPPGKMSKLIEMEKGTEDVPVHPEVDTTEYRSTDGQKGEFDPQPE